MANLTLTNDADGRSFTLEKDGPWVYASRLAPDGCVAISVINSETGELIHVREHHAELYDRFAAAGWKYPLISVDL